MTKVKRYKRYSAEFKRESILRAGEEGVTDRSVCDELGISTRQFRRWRDELQLLYELRHPRLRSPFSIGRSAVVAEGSPHDAQ